MKCPYCLNEIDEIDAYCRYCGKKMKLSFKSKPYSLIAVYLISIMIGSYFVALIVSFSSVFYSIGIHGCLFISSGVSLTLSILGIIHSCKCKKEIGVFYGLSRAIVACSLSGTLILYLCIRLMMVLL